MRASFHTFVVVPQGWILLPLAFQPV